jgi:formylglycine-generating enzyme required for sulfatase activity
MPLLRPSFEPTMATPPTDPPRLAPWQLAVVGGVAAGLVLGLGATAADRALRRHARAARAAAAAARELEPPPAPEPAAPAIALPPSRPAPLPSAAPAADDEDAEPTTLEAQRARLYPILARELALSPAQLDAVRAIFEASPVLGQGNPRIAKHPMTRAACRAARARAKAARADVARCGAPGMVPLYDPERGERPESASACIDELEFPNVPCEYPVVDVRSSEAAAICGAIGKRLCDAHEWEGACAGAVRDPGVEYAWGVPRREQSAQHNATREMVWAYGRARDPGRCGLLGAITKGCSGGGFDTCGTNSWPTGSFPECKSPLGVYDQHGNVAEHMSLPVRPEDLASRGGAGFTEMKGSWFGFGPTLVHFDDCRFRAPAWHESRVSDPGSHWNYHLGFRCCADVAPPK